MYFIVLLFVLIVVPSLINTLNYYMPGLGTLMYIGLFVYFVYLSSSKRRVQTNRTTYSTNHRNYQNQSNYQSNSTSSKPKGDVIDVEFSEQVVE